MNSQASAPDHAATSRPSRPALPLADFYAEVTESLGEPGVGTDIWPVHLFWGLLDLAVTRFSGRPAPPHPGRPPHWGPQVMLEAYSHEVSSAGYWPGGAVQSLFYSYAYPEPDGYRSSRSGRRTRSTTPSWTSSCCPTRPRRLGKIRARSCSSSCKVLTRRPPPVQRGTARPWSAGRHRRGRGSRDSRRTA